MVPRESALSCKKLVFNSKQYAICAGVPDGAGGMSESVLDLTDWHTARGRCLDWGGNLVVIDSQAEADFVMEQSGGNVLWTAYNDLVLEGLYSWDGAEESSYSKWKGGQPDGGTSENCVVISTDGFLDDVCTLRRPFACEKAVGVVEHFEGDLHAVGLRLGDTSEAYLNRVTLGSDASKWAFVGITGDFNPACQAQCAIGACPEAILGNCAAFKYTDQCASTSLNCGANSVLVDQNCDGKYDVCQTCPSGMYATDSDGDSCTDQCTPCGTQQLRANRVRVTSSTRSIGVWVSGGPVVGNEVRVSGGYDSTGLALHHTVYSSMNNTVVMDKRGVGIQLNDVTQGLVNNIVRVAVGSLCFMDFGHDGTKQLLTNNLFYGCLAKYYTVRGSYISKLADFSALTNWLINKDNNYKLPGFVSQALHLLSLKKDSPGTNTGYDTVSSGLPGVLVHDVMRLTRPVDKMDIGAHEYQGDPAP
jgi:hypothetical protein